MSALYNKAKEYIAGIGDYKTSEGLEAIAKHFGVSKGSAGMWWKRKQFPQKVYEGMYDEAMAQQEAVHDDAQHVETLPETESATFETTGVQYEPEPEQIHPQPEDRMDRLERLVMGLAEQLQAPAAGAKIPHSGVRPPSGAQNALSAAGIKNPGLPQVGAVGQGLAPTREQANSSAGGTSGRPAGPAAPRRQIEKGEPGWNGRSSPTSRDGWNDPKPKPQMVTMWPANR